MIGVKMQEIKERYNKAETEIERLDIFSELILEVRNDDAEKALTMTDELLNRSTLIDYKKGIGNAYNHRGACFWLMGEYEDGLDELTAAFSIAKEIGDISLEARATNNFGRIYRELGDMSNALRHFETALELNEQLGDELNQTINLTNISNLYYDLSDYDTALEYAMKCLPIFEKYDDSVRLSTIYNTLGNIYYKKENFKKSLYYFINNEKNTDDNTPARAIANSGLGKVYFKMNDLDKALDYLDKSLTQALELNNVEAQIAAQFYLGSLHMEQGIYRKSLQYFESALQLSEDSLRRHDLMSVHEKLSVLFDKMGNIPQAFHHMKAFEKLKEEIFQQATLNKLRNLQVKNQIEVAKKEKEVAIRTAQLKQQFMANMSHEIRTPMNAIVGITRLLLDKNTQPEQVRYLNVIKQSADNLLVIINDILDLSKIEANKIVIEKVDFSLREVINSAKEIMLVKSEEKKLDLILKIDDAIPDHLIGDPTRLNQILINLLGNAVKFTEAGNVSLICKLTKTIDSENIVVTFDVMDTGMGISKEYVDKIFESFTQAGTDTARKFGGTGLGLTISKQLVDLMKGHIVVTSEVNVGTTFSVEIPFQIAAENMHANQVEVIDDLMLEKLNNAYILLVEDNEFNRLVAEDTLKSIIPKIRIDIAENGEIAIQKLKNQHYDLILMDIQMPVMDGVSATRYIRSQMPENKRNTKIIAMTANVLQEDVQLYFKEGMNAYVSKPFQTNELLLKMSNVLKDQTPEIEIVSNSTDSVTKDLFLPDNVVDMQFLIKFTGGNEEKKIKYVNMFLDNGPKLLTQINNAWENKDFSSLKIAAHSMKPQLSYMGVKEEISNIYLIEHSAGETAHQNNIKELIRHLNKVCEKAFEELRKIVS